MFVVLVALLEGGIWCGTYFHGDAIVGLPPFFFCSFSLIWFIYRTSLLVLRSNLKSELFNLKKPAKQDGYRCYSTTLNNNAIKKLILYK